MFESDITLSIKGFILYFVKFCEMFCREIWVFYVFFNLFWLSNYLMLVVGVNILGGEFLFFLFLVVFVVGGLIYVIM